MKSRILVLILSLSQLVDAQNCDSLSLKIKEHQLVSYPDFYSKSIEDCYNRRNETGILRELCSSSQIGDTIFVLELHDRVSYAVNYTSLWNSKKPNEILSYEIHLNKNSKEFFYSKGTLFPQRMLIACRRWNINYLEASGIEHIRHWTGRAEVFLTRVIKGKTNAKIDCFVFYNFY